MAHLVQEVQAVELRCSHCGDTLLSPTGSLYWTVQEMEMEREKKPRIPHLCICNNKLFIPRPKR